MSGVTKLGASPPIHTTKSYIVQAYCTISCASLFFFLQGIGLCNWGDQPDVEVSYDLCGLGG